MRAAAGLPHGSMLRTGRCIDCPGAVRELSPRPDRQHPAGPPPPDPRPAPRRRGRTPRPGQGGVPQPRRLGEGPHRHPHDRRGRGLGRAPARRHDRGADVRQHRRRAGDGRPGPRLQVRLRLPRQGERGQAQRAQGVRRGGGRVPHRGGAGAPRLLLQRLRQARVAAGRVEAGPVLQPPEPGVALRDDRTRDLGADRREDHPLRDRHGHRRHHHRRRPLPQGAEPLGAGHRGGPRGLGLLRRHRPAVPRRGRRRGLLARDLRPRRSPTG